MSKVFVIVLNYNGLELTKECVESLKMVEYGDLHIVVVDNGSIDGSQKELPNFFPDIIFIEAGTNLGFSGGNNLGVDYAMKNGADYVILLNNDTVVDKYFVSRLVEVGEKNEEIGILTPLIYYYDEPKKIWFGGGRLEKCLTRGVHERYQEIDLAEKNKEGEFYETGFITGCAMTVKRKVIEKIGVMQDDYFLYYEDVDWSLRARRVGFKLVVVPSASIWHKISSSIKSESDNYIYYHSRNGLLCAWRNSGLLERLCVTGLSFLILSKQAVKLLFFPSKKRWAKAVTKGVFDFYKGKTGKV